MKAHNLKRWILAYISFRFFLGGVEEFIILPTAWKYVSSLGGTIPFLGAVAAAYAIGVSLFSPLFGRLARRYHYVYIIMVSHSWIKLCASVLYSVPLSKIFPLFGRFISGIADSCDGVIYDVISRYTDDVDRMKYALVFDGIFTLGTAFGAIACSSLTINENVFGWPQWSVGIGNSPGFILAGIWFIFFSLTLYLPCTFGVDITSLDKIRTVSSSSELHDDSSIFEVHMTTDDSEDEELEKTFPPKVIDSRIACLLYLTFSTMFFSSIASFFPSLLAMQLFHLKVIHVKLLFVNGTLALIVLFLVLSLCARQFQERSLLAFLLSIQLPPLIILVLLATLWNNVSLNNSYLLLIYTCLGLPYFSFSICGSLMFKLTKEEHFSSTCQPLLMALVQIAIISSRLIAGFVFSKPALVFFGLGLLLMWLVGVIWFGFVFRRLTTQNGEYECGK